MSEPNPGGQSGGADPNPGGNPGDPPAPGGAGDPGAPIFTQEHVNAMLRAERRKVADQYGDYETIKTRLTELEAAGQSELEKANAKAEEAVARATRAEAARNDLLVRSTVTSAAAKAGAIDPDIVVALVASSVKVGEDGVVEGDVEKLVTTLLEQRPFLKVSNGTSRGTADGGVHGRPKPAATTPATQMDAVLRGNRTS